MTAIRGISGPRGLDRMGHSAMIRAPRKRRARKGRGYGTGIEWQGRAGDRGEPRHRPRRRAVAGRRGLRCRCSPGATRPRSRGSRRRSRPRAARPPSRCSTCAGRRRKAAGRGGAQARFGRLDILVNNAGTTKRGDFFELTDADWADGYALKFFAHVRLTRAAWPLLKAQQAARSSRSAASAARSRRRRSPSAAR